MRAVIEIDRRSSNTGIGAIKLLAGRPDYPSDEAVEND
jgi:hypothetical protein